MTEEEISEWREANQRIVCAANQFDCGTVILGARHWDDFMHQQADRMGLSDIKCTSQGFINQFGKFLTRKESWVIAERQGQIIRDVGCDGVLYSENLY